MYKLMLCFTMCLKLAFGQELKDFDDSILFKIYFPGNLNLLNQDPTKYEEMPITTPDLENYQCWIPISEKNSAEEKKIETQLSPLHYVKAIFNIQTCSYRIEAYWSYEICHGHHIKQYHDERDGKSLKTQEYYLGKWSEEKSKMVEEKLKKDLEDGRKFRTTKIDNINYPYLELEYSDGTLCDLVNESRVTKIRYVCYPHGKNEIYTLKEVSSCNYEAVILTSTLCMHNAFVPEESKEYLINCIPRNNSPEKPLGWLKTELDNLIYKSKQQQTAFNSVGDVASILSKNQKKTIAIKINEKDGTVHMEFIDANLDEHLNQLEKIEAALNQLDDQNTSTDSSDKSVKKPAVSISKNPSDTTPIKQFLAGKNCLTGGSSWWRYEFCYGRHVRQFHLEKTLETSTVLLGIFDEKLHKEWLNKNPDKRPKEKSTRTEISHFYQSGSICDKTGEKRQTEVKLKCMLNGSGLAQVSMYLLEPRVCQYILVVESAVICDIIHLVDNDGLVNSDKFYEALEKPTTDKSNSNSEKSTEKIIVS